MSDTITQNDKTYTKEQLAEAGRVAKAAAEKAAADAIKKAQDEVASLKEQLNPLLKAQRDSKISSAVKETINEKEFKVISKLVEITDEDSEEVILQKFLDAKEEYGLDIPLSDDSVSIKNTVVDTQKPEKKEIPSGGRTINGAAF